jgi:hypothetical protein
MGAGISRKSVWWPASPAAERAFVSAGRSAGRAYVSAGRSAGGGARGLRSAVLSRRR